MRRVFALVATGASLVSANVEYDEEDMNFLRMLAFNDSNTTLAPSTKAPTTKAPPPENTTTTVAPNTTEAPATTESPATKAPATDTTPAGPSAPVSNGTVVTGAPPAGLEGNRVQTATTLAADYPNEALSSCELPKAIAVGFWEFACAKAVTSGIFPTLVDCQNSAANADMIRRRRSRKLQDNATADSATAEADEEVYTWLGVAFEYDAAWTCDSLAGWKPSLDAARRRRHLQSTSVSDEATMSVWSTDDAVGEAAVTSANALAADTAGLTGAIVGAVTAKQADIEAEVGGTFNLTETLTALTSMTVTVSVGAVEKVSTSSDSSGTTSDAYGATALGGLVLATLAASLF